MKKKEALKFINDNENLEDRFNAAYDALYHSPPISQDKMLMLYAYYKQSINGDFVEPKEEGDVSNYIQTFKNNAWSQVGGISKEEAKQKYIDMTLKVIEEDYKD